jgi:hypothetical protein
VFKDWNFHLLNPFWQDMPHCNIHECITLNILHQLHKGIFSDHVSNWAKKVMDCLQPTKEVDSQFTAMPHHPNVHHFKKGILLTSQWTGTEYKAMKKIFLGILAGATNP